MPKTKTLINFIILIVSCCFLLLDSIITNEIGTMISKVFLILISVTFGILHGCFDIQLMKNRNENTFKYHIIYILSIIIFFIIWLWVPSFALMLFLCISAKHFGETDFSIFNIKEQKKYHFVYGLSLLIWLFSNHFTTLKDNFKSVNLHSISETLETFNFNNLIFIQITSLIILITISILCYKNITTLIKIYLTIILFKYLTLEQAFLLYFGLWHSVHSILLIKNNLGQKFIYSIKKSAIYILLTYIFLALTFLLFSYYIVYNDYQNYIVIFIFVFISLLTLPHTIIMNKILK